MARILKMQSAQLSFDHVLHGRYLVVLTSAEKIGKGRSAGVSTTAIPHISPWGAGVGVAFRPRYGIQIADDLVKQVAAESRKLGSFTKITVENRFVHNSQ
jgi:hypothetical protein